jgi:hypothetical protein
LKEIYILSKKQYNEINNKKVVGAQLMPRKQKRKKKTSRDRYTIFDFLFDLLLEVPQLLLWPVRFLIRNIKHLFDAF